jgi:hypothetical protein
VNRLMFRHAIRCTAAGRPLAIAAAVGRVLT